jgi:pectinesterase
MNKYLKSLLAVFAFLVCVGMVISEAGLAKAQTSTGNLLTSPAKAVVDASFTGVNGTVKAGVKLYNSIQSALNDAPVQDKAYVICIKNGKYHEKITVNTPFITFRGESKENTILTYDVASGTKKEDGTAYGTSGSATLTIAASNFIAENMTIENAFDYPGNLAKAANDPTKLDNPQAVALKTDKGSDKVVFNNCRFLGYQDTLYANAGRQYYRQCYIRGNVDFIFGAGQAVFSGCDIVSIGKGYVTAASTKLANEYGFLFTNCRLKKEVSNVADGSVTLGRPWHPTVNMPDGTRRADPDAAGCVVFKKCYMDSHIAATGWDAMSGKDKDGKTIWFHPENLNEARFYEYGSNGPGAGKASKTRKILSAGEADKYTLENVLAGWNPVE